MVGWPLLPYKGATWMRLHLHVLDQVDEDPDVVLMTVSWADGAPELVREERRRYSTSSTWRSDLCELVHELTGSDIRALDGA